MFARVAYDPGPDYQQRLHQSDMELPDGTPDASVIREAERQFRNISGVGVFEGDEWRIISGSLP